MNLFPQQDMKPTPSQAVEPEWDNTTTGAISANSLPPEMSTFASLDALSSFLWSSDAVLGNDWMGSDLDAVTWSLSDFDAGTQIEVAPPFPKSTHSGFGCPSLLVPSINLDALPSQSTNLAALAPAFDTQSSVKPRAAFTISREESHFTIPDIVPLTQAFGASITPTLSVPEHRNPEVERDRRGSRTNPLFGEDRRLHNFRSSHLPPRGNHSAIPNSVANHQTPCHKVLQSKWSSRIRGTGHSPSPFHTSEPEHHLTTTMSTHEGVVSLTWETFDWIFSVMYPKRRSDKRIPTPSGKCLLCSSVSKKPGILQQHLTILHRQRVARKFVLGSYTSFDLVVAIAFVVAQLRSKDMELPARTECDVFCDLIRINPAGVRSVSLTEFPILGQRLTEFASQESWKGLQCDRCGVTTTRKIALVEHAVVCSGRNSVPPSSHVA